MLSGKIVDVDLKDVKSIFEAHPRVAAALGVPKELLRLAAVPGQPNLLQAMLLTEKDEEELEGDCMMGHDPLRKAWVKTEMLGPCCNPQVFFGCVEMKDRVKATKEVLYLIRYTDGDFEHLTAEQVRERKMPDGFQPEDAEDSARDSSQIKFSQTPT